MNCYCSSALPKTFWVKGTKYGAELRVILPICFICKLIVISFRYPQKEWEITCCNQCVVMGKLENCCLWVTLLCCVP